MILGLDLFGAEAFKLKKWNCWTRIVTLIGKDTLPRCVEHGWSRSCRLITWEALSSIRDSKISTHPDAKHPYLGESLLLTRVLLLRWNGCGKQTEFWIRLPPIFVLALTFFDKCFWRNLISIHELLFPQQSLQINSKRNGIKYSNY